MRCYFVGSALFKFEKNIPQLTVGHGGTGLDGDSKRGRDERERGLMLQNFQSFWPTQTPGLYLVLLSFVFYLAGLMLGRWLKRRVKVGLGWASHVFIVCASILLASRLIQVEFPGSAEIGLVAAVIAAFPINALLRRFVWPLYGYPGEKARVPSFLPQVVAIVVFVFATFSGLAAFYHVIIPGLLTGSGVIAIIIGLALQETLGNIFAGFGLQAGKAYRIGDWLIVDGKHVEVVELNWRSTRLRNNDDVASISQTVSWPRRRLSICIIRPPPRGAGPDQRRSPGAPQ